MDSYRLVRNRRHVLQLHAGSEVVAEIAMHDARYALEGIEGVRRRVVMITDRNHTLVRPSTLGHYAIDLEHTSLNWRSFPGRP